MMLDAEVSTSRATEEDGRDGTANIRTLLRVQHVALGTALLIFTGQLPPCVRYTSTVPDLFFFQIWQEPDF